MRFATCVRIAPCTRIASTWSVTTCTGIAIREGFRHGGKFVIFALKSAGDESAGSEPSTRVCVESFVGMTAP